jgi:hypothetical protein
MGRNKKYKTLEEKKEAQKKWSKLYYWKNKEKQDEKARERYHKRQTIKDEKRKKDIIEFLKCKFIEIWD